MKRPRSPPRHRGEESTDRGGEETATEDEVRERRSKQREDTRYAAHGTKEKPSGRAPAKRRQRMIRISSGSEQEQPMSPRGHDSDMHQDFR